MLILPQIIVTLTFFYWPAIKGIIQSFMLSDPFGQKSTFVWFYNYVELFTDPLYLKSILITFVFSIATAAVSISLGLFIAAMANRALKAKALTRTLLIWPYAVAPAISGIMWLFLLHPSYGIVAIGIKKWLGVNWNPVLYGTDAMVMIVMASAWKEVSYNFVFFMAGMQSVPKSLIEAAAIDGAGPFRRFWTITLPLLSPTFFLFDRDEHHLLLFRDLRHHPYRDPGGPGRLHQYPGVQGLSGRLCGPEPGLFLGPVRGPHVPDRHHHLFAVQVC